MNIDELLKLSKQKLFSLNRSLTGKGTRKTLNYFKDFYPNLKIKNFKSQTNFYDWKIPFEWNVIEAYIKDYKKNKIIDFKKNNLHLVGYSTAVNKIMVRDEILKNINTITKQPNAIPYVTSYYKKRWGFCCTHNQKKKFLKKYNKKDKFHVVIKSKFNKNGCLNYGEYLISGKSKREILISTYICHPSMANNELSGPIVSLALISFFEKINKKKKLNYSIRFLFVPETIGSISYISRNLKRLKKNTIGGFVLTCIGDEKKHSCMFSKEKDSPSNQAILEAYKKLKIKNYKIYSFLQRGSDERQYNSPGVDLAIASIFRSKYGSYKEYHTSLDNFKVVTKKGLVGGFNVAKQAIINLEKKIIPKYKFLCEPMLGKRDLYNNYSFRGSSRLYMKYLDFLQYATGRNSLEIISAKIKLSLAETKSIYKILRDKKILEY